MRAKEQTTRTNYRRQGSERNGDIKGRIVYAGKGFGCESLRCCGSDGSQEVDTGKLRGFVRILSPGCFDFHIFSKGNHRGAGHRAYPVLTAIFMGQSIASRIPIGFQLSNLLQQKGYRSYPVPTSDYRQTRLFPGLQELVAEKGPEGLPKSDTELMGMFSHRFAASHGGWDGLGKAVI